MAPGGHAYVTANKYRCDTTDFLQAVTVRLTLPNDATPLEASITETVPMDYCGPGDPGSIVHVSPIEQSFSATLSM
jgi:hypothetical protein